VEDRVNPIGGIDFSPNLDDDAVMEMQRRNRVLFALLTTLRMRPVGDDVGPETLAAWNTLRIQGAIRVLEEELYTGPELVAMGAITPAELARFFRAAPGLGGSELGARERELIDQLGAA
jgi:hypothetical protein